MIKDEIELLKKAEREAVILIEQSEEQGRELIEQAHHQVKTLILEKSQEAAGEVTRLREQMLLSAEKEAEVTRDDAEKERNAIALAVRDRIPEAVKHIHTRISG